MVTKKIDYYICPANEILSTNGTVYNKAGHLVKHYKNRKACKNCTLRIQCTTNKNGRFTERSMYQEAIEENQMRVENLTTRLKSLIFILLGISELFNASINDFLSETFFPPIKKLEQLLRSKDLKMDIMHYI